MALRPLEGFTIGITADRRWEEQAQLFERRGATIVHGPSIATMHLTANDDLRDATIDLVARPPDFLMATTAIGMRAWFEFAHSSGLAGALLEALRSCRVLARGPKAAAGCRALGLSVWAVAESERSAELVERLLHEPLAGARVAIQRSGEDAPATTEPLTAAATEVVAVSSYRWRLPDQREPAARLTDMALAGRLDAVTFTSAPALTNFFTIADDGGRSDALRAAFNAGLTAACIGPVCAERAIELGIAKPLHPGLGRLGLLVHALSDHLAGQRRVFLAHGHQITLQGNALEVADHIAVLTARERALLCRLSERPGVTHSSDRLAHQFWAQPASPHVVSVAIGRLRRKLGPAGSALHARRGRGYALLVDSDAAPPHAP